MSNHSNCTCGVETKFSNPWMIQFMSQRSREFSVSSFKLRERLVAGCMGIVTLVEITGKGASFSIFKFKSMDR